MSQNLWATIMSFGPVTNILLAQKKNFGPANYSGTGFINDLYPEN
jgi:hypothetical protein